MARSRPLKRPLRSTFFTWLLPLCLLVVYLGSAGESFQQNGWRDAVTFLLAGLGFFVIALVRGTAPKHRYGPEDSHRLRVLACQVTAVYAMAYAASLIWPSHYPAVPVIVGLGAFATAAMAAEALAIRYRAMHPADK